MRASGDVSVKVCTSHRAATGVQLVPVQESLMQDLASFESMGSAAPEIERTIFLCDCRNRQNFHLKVACVWCAGGKV